jgi:hypothetical protein
VLLDIARAFAYLPKTGVMKPRICRCCGEAMSEGTNALSRNPNVCASCSSLADGMGGSNLPPMEAPLAEELEIEIPAESAVCAGVQGSGQAAR